MPPVKHSKRTRNGALPHSAPPPAPPQHVIQVQPAIETLLKSEAFLNLPDSEIVEPASILQQILDEMRGLRTDQAALSADMARVKEQLAEREKAEAAWALDQEKVTDGWREKSDRVSPERRAAALARATAEVQQMTTAMMANQAADQMSLAQRLAAEPQVEVIRPGRTELIAGPHGPQVNLVPERYTINGMTWLIRPGVKTAVPLSVAQQIAESDRSVAETREREAALTGDLEDRALFKEWARIDRDYGSPTSDPSHMADSHKPAGMPVGPAA